MEFLNRFDQELQEAVEAQRRIEQQAEEQGTAPSTTALAYAQPARRRSLSDLMPSDWRPVAACVIIVAVIVPIVFYMVMPHIHAPQPHGDSP